MVNVSRKVAQLLHYSVDIIASPAFTLLQPIRIKPAQTDLTVLCYRTNKK